MLVIGVVDLLGVIDDTDDSDDDSSTLHEAAQISMHTAAMTLINALRLTTAQASICEG
ncbi:MAG: hypothetical protein FWF18_00905 [Dehalococcoidia bacterium]|nr:hypothetical protein [Dehalococcoidia bacterium]